MFVHSSMIIGCGCVDDINSMTHPDKISGEFEVDFFN